MTTVPLALAALEDLAETTLPNSQIIGGGFRTVTTTTERVCLIGDEDIEIQTDLDSMALDTYVESYRIPCLISVALPGPDSQTTADAQADADYTALERALRELATGPQLALYGSGVLQAMALGNAIFRRVPTENGRAAQIRFFVLVTAQNT